MKKKVLYLALFLAWHIPAFAGTNPVLTEAKNDFKKTNEAYEKTPNISMDTYYSVYSEHDSQSLLEGKNGKYIRYNKNMFVRIDDIETYAINDKIISINHQEKMISVGDNKQIIIDPILTNVDSLLSLCRDIKMERINASEKKYQLYFNEADGGEFSRVDVHIDTKNYRYVRLVLFYTIEINLKSDFYADEKQPRMEVVYKNFKTLNTEPLAFNPALYITENKGKLSPSGKYANYKVSDLRNKTRIKKSN